MLNDIQAEILRQVADLAALPETGAVNLRSDGQRAFHRDSEHVHIVSKTDKDGIDIHIDPGTKGETVHIPVVITKSGVKDLVYNDFFIGEGAEVKIVAGCGIHNCGGCDSEHDGIHTFHVGKNAKVTYVEEHYGERITIEEAAAVCYYSPSHFMKYFRQYMGISFVQYLNDYRLARAWAQLARTGETVTNIAQGCGFENLSYFNRLFKRRYGMTPGQMRQRMGQEAPQ